MNKFFAFTLCISVLGIFSGCSLWGNSDQNAASKNAEKNGNQQFETPVETGIPEVPAAYPQNSPQKNEAAKNETPMKDPLEEMFQKK